MTDYKAPLDDLRFLLHDVFGLEQFCSNYEALSDIDTDTANAILTEAAKLCEQVLAPLNAVGDEQGCQWSSEGVQSAAGFKDAYSAFCDGAWGALSGDPEYGGMGMPKTLVAAVDELVQGSNMAFGLAPMLTAGACLAIHAHASDELKSRYLPKMYSGQWAGVMDLTEAHAGTDLGLMRTKARPLDDGSYEVTGSKIFITWGEQDLSENIIHLVLAKLPDAAEGSKGISLFIVPKYLPGENGELGAKNQLSCGSIEQKMGIHGSPTCVMNFDAAKAWIVGGPNQGLKCMFTMMNYERLVVGLQGIGVAEASYQTARAYAKERLQGRAIGAPKSQAAADPIIVHPDVRRMLMHMRVMNEASRAFYLYVATWLDREKFSTDEAPKQEAEQRVALLTPIAKAFLTDRAFDSCVLGQQVLGGHGYVQEWRQEQCVRDVRITQIYEGTNGVQAMDLIGRKTVACRAALLDQYVIEMRAACSRAQGLGVNASMCDDFMRALSQLESVSLCIVDSEDPHFAGAVACDYLDFMGYVSFAYMWIKILSALAEGKSTDLMESKEASARYYFAKVLPRIHGLDHMIRAGAQPTMAIDPQSF
jgi:alkylation response protein AidB-like acyl-CoA dehydrogenase